MFKSNGIHIQKTNIIKIYFILLAFFCFFVLSPAWGNLSLKVVTRISLYTVPSGRPVTSTFSCWELREWTGTYIVNVIDMTMPGSNTWINSNRVVGNETSIKYWKNTKVSLMTSIENILSMKIETWKILNKTLPLLVFSSPFSA